MGCLSFPTLRVGAWPKAAPQAWPRPLGFSRAGARCHPGRSEEGPSAQAPGSGCVGSNPVSGVYDGDLGLVLPVGPFLSEPQFPVFPEGPKRVLGHTELLIRGSEMAHTKALHQWWLSLASERGGNHQSPTEHLLCAGPVLSVGDRQKSLPLGNRRSHEGMAERYNV